MGDKLEAAGDDAILLVLQLERRLSGREAAFLRKAALGIGQEVLARKLGVSRPTVARWEGATSLPAEHDLVLRGLILGHLLQQAKSGNERWIHHRSKFFDIAVGVLGEARRNRAPAKPRPFRIAA
jgi:DNA-binding transcriptional regulator YiaG